MSLITTTNASGFFASRAHPWRTRFGQFGPSGWLGLAIVLLIYRNLRSSNLDQVDQLKG
jgi:hypothetical protein